MELSDRERKRWVQGDTVLRNLWKSSGLSLGAFLAHVWTIDKRIAEVLTRDTRGALRSLGADTCGVCGIGFTVLSGPSIGCPVHGIVRSARA